MAKLKNDKKLDSHDFWEVSQAAVYLTGQACTLSARHIEDGLLRIQFNREVAYYARGIVRDVEEGRKTVWEALKALKDEHENLLNQSKEILFQSIGLAAGGFQFAGGVVLCSGSYGIGCGMGVLMMAQGMNNVHENAVNLWEGNSDTQGATRLTYQRASKTFGGSASDGNIAYGVIDIGTSLYGAFRLTLKKDSWRLFKYVNSDYIRAYKVTSKWVLALDAAAGAITTGNTLEEATRKNE